MKPVDRVQLIINHYKLSISAFEKKVGLSNNSIQTAIKRNSNLKDDTLNIILSVFTEIRAEWLLTGKGEMLCANNQSKLRGDVVEQCDKNINNELRLLYEKKIDLLQQLNDVNENYIRKIKGELDEFLNTQKNNDFSI